MYAIRSYYASKLDRFCDDIIYLKERNYTNKQIKEWLELNSVFISEESVRLFILKIKNSIEKPRISREGNDLLHELSTRYIWWEKSEITIKNPLRIIAQVMNVGTYKDILRLENNIERTLLIKAVTQALPGWFNGRSWSYWHYRLHICNLDESIPLLPQRSYNFV